MTSFTFALMLLRQRIDEQLRLERRKHAPRPLILALLRRQQRMVSARLRRSLSTTLALGAEPWRS